jgi:hypothetical protein
MRTVISAMAIALVAVVAMPVSQSLAAGAFDGKYRMKIAYSKKSSSNPKCEGYLFPDPFTVKGGKVSGTLRHNRRGVVFLDGTVSDDGSFTAIGSGNIVEGHVEGTLTKDGGKGTWKETRILYCDGTWTAERK